MNEITDEVIEAIASHRGVESTDLSTPLYDAVDTDALNALYRTDSATSVESYPTITFSYEGDRVVVAGPNDIEIQQQPTEIVQ